MTNLRSLFVLLLSPLLGGNFAEAQTTTKSPGQTAKGV
jgi:hypothetical protein